MATVNLARYITAEDWAKLTSRPVFVALSGGVDSVVLLHALATAWPHNARFPLSAIHVNHQLQSVSEQWSEFCVSLCTSLGIELITIPVTVDGSKNIEEHARQARYNAFFEHLPEYSVVVLGQHADDQFETILLSLKRGAGSIGIAGMPRWRDQEYLSFYRPFITAAQTDIIAYAGTHGLEWVEDPTNADPYFARNFIRKNIVAPFVARWPNVTPVIARSVEHLQHDLALLEEVVREKHQLCIDENADLCISSLQNFSHPWQVKICQYHLKQSVNLVLSTAQIRSLFQVINAQDDAQGELRVGEYILRRFADRLWLTAKSEDERLFRYTHTFVKQLLDAPATVADTGMVHSIFTELSELHHLHLGFPETALISHFSITCTEVALSAVIKPWQAAQSKPIKQWCKLYAIPPWQRTPSIFIEIDKVPVGLIIGTRIVPLAVTTEKFICFEVS